MHQRATAAIAAGVGFLAANQGRDGLWRDFHTPAGEASTWPTAYIGNALRTIGVDIDAVGRAARALVERQQHDGGWGYNEETPSDADSTSWAVLFLSQTIGPDNTRLRARTCLARHQRGSGGVATYAEPGPIRRYMGMPRWVPFWGWCRPQIEVTAVAGRAYGALGSAVSLADATALWRYVRSRQNPDGSWSSYWWMSSHFATAQAVALAHAMRDEAPAQRAGRWALRGQQQDGGWVEPGAGSTSCFATALALAVLAESGLDVRSPIGRGVEALVDLQQDDGGWPSHAALRIPVPPDPTPSEAGRKRLIRFNDGIIVPDQHRLFTTATCAVALAGAVHAATSS